MCLCLDHYLQDYLRKRILRTLSSRSEPLVFQKRSDLKRRSIEIFIAEFDGKLNEPRYAQDSSFFTRSGDDGI